jgi:hypothetical protein
VGKPGSRVRDKNAQSAGFGGFSCETIHDVVFTLKIQKIKNIEAALMDLQLGKIESGLVRLGAVMRGSSLSSDSFLKMESLHCQPSFHCFTHSIDDKAVGRGAEGDPECNRASFVRLVKNTPRGEAECAACSDL